MQRKRAPERAVIRDMSDLDGIFLDFYGTVASGDRAAVTGICARVVKDLGLNVTADELAVMWGQRYFSAIEACGSDNFRCLSQIEFDTLIDTVKSQGRSIEAKPYIRMLNEYLSQPTLFDEVREVLEGLSIPVCIVSNADERELLAAVEHLGLRFHGIVTSERARSYKPDAGIFQTALDMTGWRPERVVHVGDSLHSDVGGARKLSIRSIWVNRADRISDIGTHTPDFEWEDLRPLLTLGLS
jgi:2-haloalkanoic acid dehalogenase type II